MPVLVFARGLLERRLFSYALLRKQEAKSVIVEARRQSRQVPSIVAHEYRDEPQDDAISGGKGLRVPGSAAGHELERMGSLDVPTKVDECVCVRWCV